MKHVGLTFFGVIPAAILMLVPLMSFAEDETPEQKSQAFTQIKPAPQGRAEGDKTLLDDLHRMIPGPPVKVSDYWIGVQCTDILPPLRSHLQLDEKQGMLVEWVMPDSPAAKAGVEQYDVFLAVNGTPVSSVADIIKVVDEVKDGELTVSAIRKGQPVEVKIMPEKRPENATLPEGSQMPGMPRQRIFRSFQPGVIIEEMGPGGQIVPQQEIPEHMRQMLEQIQKQLEEQMNAMPESGGFRFEATPGTAQRFDFGGFAAHPGGSTMQISIEPPRDGREGTLTIRKNNQTWSVAKFADLPEDVQKEVAEVLENTVNGQDVGDWIAEQMANNRRVTFSVTVSGKISESSQGETVSE